MTRILDLLDVKSFIQNSGYTAMLLTMIENMSSNATWYCGEIEPVNRFITNPTWLLGYHLVIFNTGYRNFGSKTYVRQPQTLQLLRFYDTG